MLVSPPEPLLCRQRTRGHIHAFMQHANDLGGLVRGELVIEQMATNTRHAIAHANIVSGLAKPGVVGSRSATFRLGLKYDRGAIFLIAHG